MSSVSSARECNTDEETKELRFVNNLGSMYNIVNDLRVVPEKSKIRENRLSSILEETNEEESKIIFNKVGIDYSRVNEKFEKNQIFEKSTHDFIKKLEKHFKNKKSSQECTSLINTVHNLYTQHIGKLLNKKGNEIDKDTINEYFIYLLYISWEKGYFQGKMFKNWR